MFLGLGGDRDRNQNASTCWANLEFGFKYFFVTEMIFGLLVMLMPALSLYFSNIPYVTIFYFQIWRLITSFMVPQGIIGVLFQMWILYQFMPEIVFI